MTNVQEYRGHIRNWEELCRKLEIWPGLPREDMEPLILTKAYEKWGYDIRAVGC